MSCIDRNGPIMTRVHGGVAPNMAGIWLELELGLGLWPGFSVKVSRVNRVRVNVKARLGFRVRVSDHVWELQSSRLFWQPADYVFLLYIV